MYKITIVVWWFGICFLLTESVSSILHPHPLDPLTPIEIETAVQILEKSKGSMAFIYSYISLLEPHKSLLLPSFLEDSPSPHLPRKAFLNLLEKSTQRVYEAIVNLESSTTESFILIENVRGPFTPQDFFNDHLDYVLADSRVQERCAGLGYPNMSLIKGIEQNFIRLEPGDGRESERTRSLVEYYLYGSNFIGDNYHAHPFDFTVIYDMVSRLVVEIQDMPSHAGFGTNNAGNMAPKREGNFDYEFRGGKQFLRQDDKPIVTESPEGASYTLDGNQIQWQKWKMRVGFNGREGLTLHTVSYNDSGQNRPILYRAALAEVFVPYGDPRPPFQRAEYFDIGEYGLGYFVDSNKPDEDILGTSTFLHANLHTRQGLVRIVPNAISIREEDAGILWKHVDFRTGKGVVARSHRLVISVTMTANNYDYSFAWKFYQDGSIQYEVLLLGMLYTTMVADGFGGGSYSTLVAPQVGAPFHQHFFTVRLDLDIDGVLNSISTQDVVPLSGPSLNPYRQGFSTRTNLLRTSSQGRSKIDPLKGRTWVVANPNVLHNLTGEPVGWKLMPNSMTPLLMRMDSPWRERPAWVEYDLWVTPYKEDQLFPGGRYLNRSGLTEWVASDPGGNIVNEDLVLWHTFGLTHIPRPEDYPVMPVETAGFWLKPYNFFKENPAIDVPPPPGNLR